MSIGLSRICRSPYKAATLLRSLSHKSFSWLRQNWLDVLLFVALATGTWILAFEAAKLINPVLIDSQARDVWFSADLDRTFSNMIDRASNHYRTKVHPLFSLIAFPPVFLLTKITGFEPLVSVKILIATVAALWSGTLFALLRLINLRSLDAVLFTGLALTSAAAMFWFTVPETYSFSSLTIVIAFCFLALTEYYQFSSLWYVSASALTLSITITNWMVGILLAIVSLPRKRAFQTTINAFCLVVLLWGVQKFIFTTAVFFLGDREEKSFLFLAGTGGLWHILKSLISHTMVMPAINQVPIGNASKWQMLSVQLSQPGSGSLWGSIATVLWTTLLGMGVWGFLSQKTHFKVRSVLALALLGQISLHLVYGDEAFLYSLHFIPLLILLAAFSTLTRARFLALLLASALLLTAGVNNITQLNRAARIVDAQSPNRYQVLTQMQQRPQDPWPRGAGHVVLAAPSSLEEDKAYHEPGGSFSPSVGSFGVSLWLADQSGKLKSTSDSIPLSKIEQQFRWSGNQSIPSILTNTNDYQAQWSALNSKDWMLNFTPKRSSDLSPNLVIRSVGPVGGPINSLNWDGSRLLINHRWALTLDPLPKKVSLGEEGHKGWISESSNLQNWQNQNGWGYARFELANSTDWHLTIHDSQASVKSNGNSFANTHTDINLDLPNKEFTDSLNAQVAHLMMGLVGQETRPGDPTNYPLTWQRDGAYVVVALARAGKLQDAKRLSNYLAEHDFFGGFGAEADAPGLSIWALEEVSNFLKDKEYDQWIWPHVQRKANFILEMMTATKPIYHDYKGSVVPSYKDNRELPLVAEPARDGLIVGRMDWQRPLLFINAVSYRGLLAAASLATRVDRTEDALHWRDAATKLQAAWEKALREPGEIANERTYISALWPTWIGVNRKNEFTQLLENRWQQLRDDSGSFRVTPLWTYFDVAEAHQWLFLNQPDRLWMTLQWFFNHQASPGLYTWWEGNGEENSFHRWEKVRGWVKPKHITPHYWTAAEMLLMQLDMLAYTDYSAAQPTIVVGAGIPKDWLRKPMSVKGLVTPEGKLDWIWDGRQMQVKVFGEKVAINLSSVFPANTPLKVEYVR